jgi:tetratricopeptide (TPR) repeat protein
MSGKTLFIVSGLLSLWLSGCVTDGGVGQTAPLSVREGAHSADPAQAAEALFNKGLALREHNQDEDVIATCEELTRRFGRDASPFVRQEALEYAGDLRKRAADKLQKQTPPPSAGAETAPVEDDPSEDRVQAAVTLYSQGYFLRQNDQPDAAIAVYEALDQRFGKDDDPEVRTWVAGALFSKGWILKELRRYQDAIATYEALDRRFAKDDHQKIRSDVLEALVRKGELLYELRRFKDADAVFEEIYQRFGKSDNPEVRYWAAEALIRKGHILSRNDQSDAAIAAYETVYQRFGTDDSPEVRGMAAEVLFEKGGILYERGQYQEAIAAHEALARRLAKDASPRLRQWAANALEYADYLRKRAADDPRRQTPPPTVEQP